MLDFFITAGQVLLFVGLTFYSIALIVISFLVYVEDPKIAFRQRVLSIVLLTLATTVLIV